MGQPFDAEGGESWIEGRGEEEVVGGEEGESKVGGEGRGGEEECRGRDERSGARSVESPRFFSLPFLLFPSAVKLFLFRCFSSLSRSLSAISSAVSRLLAPATYPGCRTPRTQISSSHRSAVLSVSRKYCKALSSIRSSGPNLPPGEPPPFFFGLASLTLPPFVVGLPFPLSVIVGKGRCDDEPLAPLCSMLVNQPPIRPATFGFAPFWDWARVLETDRVRGRAGGVWKEEVEERRSRRDAEGFAVPYGAREDEVDPVEMGGLAEGAGGGVESRPKSLRFDLVRLRLKRPPFEDDLSLPFRRFSSPSPSPSSRSAVAHSSSTSSPATRLPRREDLSERLPNPTPCRSRSPVEDELEGRGDEAPCERLSWVELEGETQMVGLSTSSAPTDLARFRVSHLVSFLLPSGAREAVDRAGEGAAAVEGPDWGGMTTSSRLGFRREEVGEGVSEAGAGVRETEPEERERGMREVVRGEGEGSGVASGELDMLRRQKLPVKEVVSCCCPVCTRWSAREVEREFPAQRLLLLQSIWE